MLNDKPKAPKELFIKDNPGAPAGAFDTKPKYGPGNFAPRPQPAEETTRMEFKIESFYYKGNGIIVLEVPAKRLPEETRELFRKHFPNTGEQLYDLVAKENVIAAMFNREYAAEPPQFEREIESERH